MNELTIYLNKCVETENEKLEILVGKCARQRNKYYSELSVAYFKLKQL